MATTTDKQPLVDGGVPINSEFDNQYAPQDVAFLCSAAGLRILCTCVGMLQMCGLWTPQSCCQPVSWEKWGQGCQVRTVGGGRLVGAIVMLS